MDNEMKEQELQGLSLSPASGSTEVPGVTGSELSVTVTPHNYPAIFKAFREIDYANGAVNRFEPERTSYQVPAPFSRDLAWGELGLSSLDEQEFETFCDGDYDEAQVLIKSMPFLKPASALLNAYFNGWVIDGNVPTLRDVRALVQGISFNAENNSESSDFVSRTKEFADAAVKLLDQMIGDQPEQVGDGLSPVSGLAGAPGVTGSVLHTDECLRYAAQTGKPFCIAACRDARFHVPQYIRDITAYLAANQNESVAVLVVNGAHRIVKIPATNWEAMDAAAALLNLCRDARAFHEAGKDSGDFARLKPNETPAPVRNA